jgi:hypothetical protein
MAGQKQEIVQQWVRIIRSLYPDILRRTYCVPPLHFNRVPYDFATVSGGEVVLVALPSGACKDTCTVSDGKKLFANPRDETHPVSAACTTADVKAGDVRAEKTKEITISEATVRHDVENGSTSSGNVTGASRKKTKDSSLGTISGKREAKPPVEAVESETRGAGNGDTHDAGKIHSCPLEGAMSTAAGNVTGETTQCRSLGQKKKGNQGLKNNSTQANPTVEKSRGDGEAGKHGPLKAMKKLPKVSEFHVQSDFAQQHVLTNLRKLGEHRQEAMFIVSELDFKDYLNKSQYNKVTATLPRPATMEPGQRAKGLHKGDFDLLLFCKNLGVLVGELKSVGRGCEGGATDEVVRQRVREALAQVDKEAAMVRHPLSDVAPDVVIKTTLFLPYVTSQQLLRVLAADGPLTKVQHSLESCLNCVRVRARVCV